jgi:hypothetical protein
VVVQARQVLVGQLLQGQVLAARVKQDQQQVQQACLQERQVSNSSSSSSLGQQVLVRREGTSPQALLGPSWATLAQQ